MSNDTTRQSVLFPDLFKKPVIVQFDEPQASNDGGAILLKACDDRLGLSAGLAARIADNRQQGKVVHSIQDLVRQRLFAIACGYPDCNDAARLASDPIQKMLNGRDPISEVDLASQPTLSRFENAPRRADLYGMGEELMETVVERHRQRLGRRKVKKIAIDLDPTDDPTHGHQQLALFNGHYDTWCYLPVAGFIRFNDEPDQYLFTCVLRPGNASASDGAIGILRRVIEHLQEAFPRARILVRLDGGFGGPELLNFLEDDVEVDYVIGLGKNQVLKRRAKRLMGKARRISKRRGETASVFGETRYSAGTWKKRERRVIIKAEVVRQDGKDPKDNQRFVVTNLKGSPRHIYKKIYCYRGDIENRIKELHHGLEIDRTSCCDFLANQFRVLLTAAALVLFQELRLHAGTGELARAQVTTLREHLLKLGAWVERSVRRIVIHMPESFPHLDDWRRIARSLGASTA
jgi:Transposase DDE domain group 1